jgi:hypothetical protein
METTPVQVDVVLRIRGGGGSSDEEYAENKENAQAGGNKRKRPSVSITGNEQEIEDFCKKLCPLLEEGRTPPRCGVGYLSKCEIVLLSLTRPKLMSIVSLVSFNVVRGRHRSSEAAITTRSMAIRLVLRSRAMSMPDEEQCWQ